MNLPNKITVSRILLIPVVIFFYLSTSFIPFGKLISAGVFVIACLTDFLDGYYARKLNLVTNLGKFLDTIADKMLVLSALILVVADNTITAPFGVIFAVIIIARELMVSALRQLAATKNVVIAADMWGKIKANFQYFAITFFMVLSYFIDNVVLSNGVMLAFQIICWVLMVVTVIATVLSGVHYIVKNKEVFVDGNDVVSKSTVKKVENTKSTEDKKSSEETNEKK